VSGAVHAVHAHLGFRIRTLFTLDTGAPSLCDGTADPVEAVGARVALFTDVSAYSRGVRALPARDTLAIRGSVGVLADRAFVTPRKRTVLLLAVLAHEAIGFQEIRDLPLLGALVARRHAGVWSVRLLADAQRARAQTGSGIVLALDACGAG
jgi:hypothetical protein